MAEDLPQVCCSTVYVPVISQVDPLENTNCCSRVLRGVASMDVVSMAVSPILKQCLSLLIHPRTVQQTLQFIGLSKEREREMACIYHCVTG